MLTAETRPAPLSLKTSWAYQHRLHVTAILCGCAWTWVALTPPRVGPNSVLHWVLECTGWVCFILGASVRMWATLWIAERKKRVLVDDGPYRMCRNPLYVGTFTMAIGINLLLKSLVFAAGLAVVIGIYALFVVPAEEAYLRNRLGAIYEDYLIRVPRWIPSLGKLRRKELVRAISGRKAVYREAVRMGWWMLLPLLAELTCRLRGTPWWTAFIGES